MSKTVKTLLGLAGGGLVIVAILLWVLASNLDGIVKGIIEDVGSETLGTDVSLNSVEIKLADASAALRGLTIANPPGFNTSNAFELGAIAVTLDPTTATTSEVVIPRIVIAEASLTFEQTGENNNLKTLMDQLNQKADSSSDAAAGKTEAAGDEVLIVIEELQLKGASMTLVVDKLTEPLTLTLADITVRDIGKRGAGVTPEEAARQIINPILKRAEDNAKERLREELKQGVMDKVGEATSDFVDKTKGLFKD
jgi:uncharacterized protein involved in outer membrane biogenesis